MTPHCLGHLVRRGPSGAEARSGGAAVSFSNEERAELIAALSKTADMVGLLLNALEVRLLSRLSEERSPFSPRHSNAT